jgi:DNA-binding CsgD family transcriptional regulator
MAAVGLGWLQLLGWRRSAPRPVAQMRQLLKIGAILRWAGLVMAGVIGALAPPKAPVGLVLVLLVFSGYNTWTMLAARAASDEAIPRIARVVTLCDETGCLAILWVFSNLTGGSQIAFYVPAMVEAVAFFSLAGAVSSVVVFVVGITAMQGIGTLIGHQPLSWTVVFVWTLIMLVVGSALAAVDLVSLEAGPAQEPPAETTPPRRAGLSPAGPAVRLSTREQEVLRLIAAGYSNAMIAEELHLGETTVKTHVENLLTRLSVRNRAEAVAAASRLGLL